jgi:DNA polymerase-1
MNEVELPLIRVVADLEDNGYRINCTFFDQLRKRLEVKTKESLRRIRRKTNPRFNPRSAEQLRELLYKKLKIKVTTTTKGGEPSTENAVLARAAKKHPVVRDIQRYRALNKLLTTYAKIPETVDDDHRLRVTYNQLAAETGRFSSSSIIQTMPKNDEFEIRKGFAASKGCVIVGADFDQQELRVLAQCSGDKRMKQAIARGVDLHGLAAVRVFDLKCAPNEVKEKFKRERDRVKAIQFGLVYGRSPRSLAIELGIPVEEAEQLVEEYFKQFPAVKAFIASVHKKLLRDGYVDDIFGRRRYFPDVNRRPPRTKQWRFMSDTERDLARKIAAAKRQAQNFVIQGASATITKLAMIRCHQHITAEHPDIKMILTLHDELHFEVPKDLVSHLAGELPHLMCDLDLDRFGFTVPMQVEVKVGPSWGSLQRWEETPDGAKRKKR